jgi:anaerobic selenocysteine-containing dehydrogenase
MLRRDFLKTAAATAVLTAFLPAQAKEPVPMSNETLPT